MAIKNLTCGFLVLTYSCNNRCKWCYAKSSGFKKDMMGFAKAKGFLKLMKSLKIKDVGLIGGEAIFHPKVYDIIKFGKSLGMCMTLYTNGRALADEKIVKKLKNAGTDFINFSIQTGSSHSEKHDKTVNVKGAWQQTKKGVDNCVKYGLGINIQNVLTHTRLDVYKEFLDEFRYTNALFVFYREIPIVSCDKKMFSAKVLSNKDTKDIFKKIFIYAKNKNRVYFFSRMSLCWWDKKEYTEKEIHKQVVCHCHVVNGMNLAIDVDGRVLPCPQFIKLPSLNLVQKNKVISESEFIKKYNSGISKKVRENLTYYPDRKCEDCRYYGKRCTGGCPLINFEIGPFA